MTHNFSTNGSLFLLHAAVVTIVLSLLLLSSGFIPLFAVYSAQASHSDVIRLHDFKVYTPKTSQSVQVKYWLSDDSTKEITSCMNSTTPENWNDANNVFNPPQHHSFASGSWIDLDAFTSTNCTTGDLQDNTSFLGPDVRPPTNETCGFDMIHNATIICTNTVRTTVVDTLNLNPKPVAGVTQVSILLTYDMRDHPGLKDHLCVPNLTANIPFNFNPPQGHSFTSGSSVRVDEFGSADCTSNNVDQKGAWYVALPAWEAARNNTCWLNLTTRVLSGCNNGV
jgi:hypothetical protein